MKLTKEEIINNYIAAHAHANGPKAIKVTFEGNRYVIDSRADMPPTRVTTNEIIESTENLLKRPAFGSKEEVKGLNKFVTNGNNIDLVNSAHELLETIASCKTNEWAEKIILALNHAYPNPKI
jgi:hypothetical protein